MGVVPFLASRGHCSHDTEDITGVEPAVCLQRVITVETSSMSQKAAATVIRTQQQFHYGFICQLNDLLITCLKILTNAGQVLCSPR